MQDTIKFDKEKAKAFREAYKQALAERKEVFTFEGKVVFTPYAKYLCEYLVLHKLLPKEH